MQTQTLTQKIDTYLQTQTLSIYTYFNLNLHSITHQKKFESLATVHLERTQSNTTSINILFIIEPGNTEQILDTYLHKK